MEQISLAYLNTLGFQELLQARREYLNLVRRNRDTAEFKFNLKETDKTDLLRLDIELQNARNDLINTRESLYASWVLLNKLMNLPQEIRLELDRDEFTEKKYIERSSKFDLFFRTERGIKVIREFFTKQTFQYSAELQQIKANILQTESEKELAVSKFYPSAQLKADWFDQLQNDTRDLSEIESQRLEDIYSNGWSVKGEVSFPIYLGGERFKQVDQARAKVLEFMNRERNLKIDLSERARTGLFQLYRNRKNLDYAMSNVKSSTENMKIANVQYLQGDLPVIDLLNIQTNLILSQISSISARYSFYQSLISLYRTMGRRDLIEKFQSREVMSNFRMKMLEYYMEHIKKKYNLDSINKTYKK